MDTNISLPIPEQLKGKLDSYREKLKLLYYRLQDSLRLLQQKIFGLIAKNKVISFDDFIITKEITIEEYIQKKDEYKNIKFKTEDAASGYIYTHDKQCYSFNYFSNIFLKKQSGESKLLIAENHLNANKTRIMFAYHLNGEHVYDQYILETSSKFYEKDMSKLEFLMQYHLKTLDNIFIMSDKLHYKMSDIPAFVAIEQIEHNEIINTFNRIKILNSTQEKIKLWLVMVTFAVVYPIATFFAFEELLSKLDIEYQNRLKTQKLKIAATENQLTKIKKDVTEINNKIKISKKEIYEPKK